MTSLGANHGFSSRQARQRNARRGWDRTPCGAGEPTVPFWRRARRPPGHALPPSERSHPGHCPAGGRAPPALCSHLYAKTGKSRRCRRPAAPPHLQGVCSHAGQAAHGIHVAASPPRVRIPRRSRSHVLRGGLFAARTPLGQDPGAQSSFAALHAGLPQGQTLPLPGQKALFFGKPKAFGAPLHGLDQPHLAALTSDESVQAQVNSGLARQEAPSASLRAGKRHPPGCWRCRRSPVNLRMLFKRFYGQDGVTCANKEVAAIHRRKDSDRSRNLLPSPEGARGNLSGHVLPRPRALGAFSDSDSNGSVADMKSAQKAAKEGTEAAQERQTMPATCFTLRKSIQRDGVSEAPGVSLEKQAAPWVGFGSLEPNESFLTRFNQPVPATRCGFSGPIREGKTKPFLLEIAATSLLSQAFQPCP